MFDKLLETKKDRELCTRFLAFLRKKGYLEADFDKEKEIAEFFGIDLEQAEKDICRQWLLLPEDERPSKQSLAERIPDHTKNGIKDMLRRLQKET